jgi:hypothetical protein
VTASALLRAMMFAYELSDACLSHFCFRTVPLLHLRDLLTGPVTDLPDALLQARRALVGVVPQPPLQIVPHGGVG